ncbi:MAG: hypothetical protein E7I62_06410 [Bilophila wadsworthia]|uniref:NACHT domain-containing protein n=1 Tax=Bilophila wadsworthia TaxID=35833 RepID=UPI0029078063|nr:hypothetical protein [Bilophila wadsworthia]MDU4375220.1 hypothetical protein [Bilophila wadsworthia]
MTESWEWTENFIRKCAESKWGCTAQKENISGNSIDVVVKYEKEYYILIEVTENDRLEKVRNDISKLIISREYLRNINIFAKCYIIVNGRLTESMIQNAENNNIIIETVETFFNNFFGYKEYINIRSNKSFGSCIDIETGANEENEYIPVKYTRFDIQKDFLLKEKGSVFITDIIDYLKRNKKIILLGEYGSGKSRCLKKLFDILSKNYNSAEEFPVAINLRDCSGLKRDSEILRRHYEDLGLSVKADGLLKIWKKSNFTYLFDGFDEIASQGWSTDKETIKNIRFQALSGIREIIQFAPGGVIICGREYYFSSTSEMLTSLGISKAQAVIIKCNEEFADEEFDDFLNTTGKVHIPKWLPRRPLICSIISKLSPKDRNLLLNNNNSEVLFWNQFIDLICKREERMGQTFVADTIKKILVRISRATRNKNNEVGPIKPIEIKKAFEDILGSYPIDQASVLLQRLVGLGRYESESEDRKFADIYILDGLRGLDVIDIINNSEHEVFLKKWSNPVKKLGQKIISDAIPLVGIQKALTLLRKNSYKENGILLSDIVCGIFINAPYTDFKNICINDGHISYLDISLCTPNNISLQQTIFDEIYTGANFNNGFLIKDSIITRMIGVSSPQRIPNWVRDCEVGEYIPTLTVSAIKNTSLSDNHKVLLTIIHKVFFQPGSARREEALVRGLGASAKEAKFEKIINTLIRKDIISKYRGESGYIYTANRKYMDRMRLLQEEKSSSRDELWDIIGKL